MLFVYLYSDILPFFHRDIYVINTCVCTYWLKSTRHCRVDMQFELFFSIYFYKWHVCITCCVMGRIWIMRQICVIFGLSWIWACLGRRKQNGIAFCLRKCMTSLKIKLSGIAFTLMKCMKNINITVCYSLQLDEMYDKLKYNRVV